VTHYERNSVLFVRVMRVLLAGAFAAAPLGPHAQNLIKGPVRIIVPVAAGGTSDISARLIADKIKDAIGQPVVVENKPGATGRIAVEAFKNAAPDGRTLLLAPVAVPVIAPLVFKQLNYDPAKDLVPVAQVAKFQYAFAVGPNHPARTLPEFVAWARAHPEHANFGTAGAGSVPHLFGVMVGRATGVELVHVAHKGVTSVLAELMGGQIAAGISALSDLAELHRAGKIRILATSGAERSPLLPEVPTFKEQGFAAVEGVGWNGVYAPARTPRPVIDRLSSAIVKALRAPELRQKFIDIGLEPTGTTPEELAAIMADDTARWSPIIKASGLAADAQ